MKLQLGKTTSDIFIAVYVVITLYLRFYIEPLFRGNVLLSLFIGLFALFIIWALVKIKFLNPNWFGLYKKSKNQ
jgi:hypothetical protein